MKRPKTIDVTPVRVVTSPAPEQVLPVLRPRAPVVRRVERCPLCERNRAETEVRIGPAIIRVCNPCSQPVYHVMGIYDWLKKIGGRRR